jgi:transmembrane sensor
MEPAEAKLTQLGERIREALAAEATPSPDLRAARAGFLERVAVRNSSASAQTWSSRGTARRLRWLFLVGAAASGAAGILIWQRLPISFQVGVAATPGRMGDLVEATVATPLRFSEGSSLLLQQGSKMRVLSSEPKGARVLIENGAVDVAITHVAGAKARWSFEAGPFRVLVTGTRFKMVFHPEDLSLNLATQEGQVVVTAPCLKAPKPVSAGESLDLSCMPKVEPETQLAMLSDLVPTVPVDDKAAAGRRVPARNGANWRDLLGAGHLAAGLHAAERANFDQVCQVANPKELLALADAARLFGRAARAVTALRVLRFRFPASADAATAAFSLGRIAFERQRNYADAVRWFATYLREQPAGPLMGDSVGRLMEARLRSGDEMGARKDAEQYLRRFPEGPYASEARGILSN